MNSGETCQDLTGKLFVHSLFISKVRYSFAAEFVMEDPPVVMVPGYLNCHLIPNYVIWSSFCMENVKPKSDIVIRVKQLASGHSLLFAVQYRYFGTPEQDSVLPMGGMTYLLHCSSWHRSAWLFMRSWESWKLITLVCSWWTFPYPVSLWDVFVECGWLTLQYWEFLFCWSTNIFPVIGCSHLPVLTGVTHSNR